METYLIGAGIIIVLLVAFSTYALVSCKKARDNASFMKNKIEYLEKEVTESGRHRAILRATVKTLLENSSDIKKKNDLLEMKLKASQQKVDAFRKFIKDMKES